MKIRRIIFFALIVIVALTAISYTFYYLNRKDEIIYEIINFEQLDAIKNENQFFILLIKQDGCFACTQVEPIIDELSKQGQIKIVSIIGNRPQNERVYDYLNISVTPTTIFFMNGEEIDRIIGAFDRNTIELKIKENQP